MLCSLSWACFLWLTLWDGSCITVSGASLVTSFPGDEKGLHFFSYTHLKTCSPILERGEEETEREKERNINQLPPHHALQAGTKPTTQAHALTRNQTCDPLADGLMLPTN